MNLWKYFLILTLFCSCTVSSHITLMKDGSAKIVGSSDSQDTAYSFYKSSQISNFSDSKGIHFTIKNIDSLGNYFSPLIHKNTLEFNYSNDTLRIKETNTPFYNLPDNVSHHLYLELTSEMKIKDVHSKNGDYKLKKNKVTITKKRSDFRKDNKRMDLIIVF